jgi:hypothetical protein
VKWKVTVQSVDGRVDVYGADLVTTELVQWKLSYSASKKLVLIPMVHTRALTIEESA